MKNYSIVVSFSAVLGSTHSSKYANRDNCVASSACGAATADEQACQPANRRPDALGYAFASLGAVALGAGHRQAGNSNCLAAQGVSILLALEEQGREVGKALREPGSTRANPADEHAESTAGRTNKRS